MARFVISQRELMRILREYGFIQTHQRGSHQYWEKSGLRVTVDIKYSEFSGWLLQEMIRSSGLPKSAFRKR